MKECTNCGVNLPDFEASSNESLQLCDACYTIAKREKKEWNLAFYALALLFFTGNTIGLIMAYIQVPEEFSTALFFGIIGYCVSGFFALIGFFGGRKFIDDYRMEDCN